MKGKVKNGKKGVCEDGNEEEERGRNPYEIK